MTADPRIPERVWVYCDALGGLLLARQKPMTPYAAQFMRVLSRAEVDKLAMSEEGVDAMQMINSLHRTIDGQRRHIARLQEQLRAAEHELGQPSTEEAEPDSFRNLGIRESDFLP